MQVCGICGKIVNQLNTFYDNVGSPPVPLYQIIRHCVSSSNFKYIENGVCNDCTADLTIYNDAVALKKLMKSKLLNCLRNAQKSKVETSHVLDIREDKGQVVHEITDNGTDCDMNIVDEVNGVQERNHVKSFVCELCGKVLRSQKTLGNHIILHGKEKPFECTICGEKFYFHVRLKDHMKYHRGEKPYKCETCGKCFRHQSNLSAHKNEHKNVAMQYQCKVCNLGFSMASRLKYHEMQHSTERKYFCRYCNRGFASKYNIPQHLKVNKKCAAALKNDRGLNFNNNYEDGNSEALELGTDNTIPSKLLPNERECNICGKIFLKISGLKRHMFTHAEVKDFKCPNCKYSTANKSALDCHFKNSKKCAAIRLSSQLE